MLKYFTKSIHSNLKNISIYTKELGLTSLLINILTLSLNILID